MTEQSSSALSDFGLNKLHPSFRFPIICESGLEHSERAGDKHTEKESIFLPQCQHPSYCDVEGLHHR